MQMPAAVQLEFQINKPAATGRTRQPKQANANKLRAKCVHYAYKMRPNFKTQILMYSKSDTYEVYAQKCSHSLTRLLLLPARASTRSPNPVNIGTRPRADYRFFSLGERVG